MNDKQAQYPKPLHRRLWKKGLNTRLDLSGIGRLACIRLAGVLGEVILVTDAGRERSLCGLRQFRTGFYRPFSCGFSEGACVLLLSGR